MGRDLLGEEVGTCCRGPSGRGEGSPRGESGQRLGGDEMGFRCRRCRVCVQGQRGGCPVACTAELCVSRSGRLPVLASVLLPFWNSASFFGHFSLMPGVLPLGFGLVAAVTPCVGL